MKSSFSSMITVNGAFFLLLFFLMPVFAVEKGPAIKDYPVQKLSDHVYVIHGPLQTPNPENQGFMNNPGIVLTNKGVVIIDPGGTVQSGEMVLRVVKTLTDLPVIAVFDTHVHGDHWLGNQAIKQMYPEVSIYAHPDMIAEVDAGAGKSWLKVMQDATKGKSAGTRVVNANHAINNGDILMMGEVKFEIFHFGKAHTDTDIMISVNGNEALFMGDNLLNGRLGRTSDGNIKQLIESCEKVAELNPKVIIPGHGKSGDMKMFNHSLDLFRILYQSVEKYYQDDLSDFEMKPLIIKDLSTYRDWEEFNDLIGKTISQVYLEVEDANF
ncbi:MAG: MBL fold metallo-hydrolase [bacterium]